MTDTLVQGFAELTLEVRDRERLERFRRLDAVRRRLDRAGVGHRGPVEHPGGDRSLYVEDPEGNVVEIWDFFERDEGRREGAAALGDEDHSPNPSH